MAKSSINKPNKKTSCFPKKCKNCSDLNITSTIEFLHPDRIGYFFKVNNNGPSVAVNAELTVLFSGVIDPPTQAGWNIDGHIATYNLGNLDVKKPPMNVILTFSAKEASSTVGTLFSDTTECGLGNNSIVSSFLM